MRLLTRLVILILLTGFLVSAPPPLSAATTDTFRDEFNSISYSGSDGVGGSWVGAWWDSQDQDETAGDVKVDSDGTEDFVLRFNSNGSGQYAERTADLTAYDTATVSFDYRRKNTDATFSLKVWASATGLPASFTEIFSIATGDDAVYVGSGNLDLTPYRSPTTTIRFSYEAGALGPGKDFYVDNVEISASAANTAPVAVDDADFTLIDNPITIDVLANDSDPDLDPLSITAVTSGSNGGVTSTPTNVTYTPNPGWTGIDTFTYTIWDGAEFGTATVTVTVVDEIIYRDEFNAQVYDGSEGTVPWSSDWVASGGSGPLVGERRVDADGAELYVLMFDYSTPGEYVERSADLSVLSNAELTFDYRQQFMTPATGFEVQVSEDGSIWNTVWSMWGSGTDASYVPASVDLSAYSGAPTIIRFTHITGTPANFFFHIDNVQIAEAALANQPPTAIDDTDGTAEDTAVTVDVLGNDTDPESDPLSVDSVTQGLNGSVVNNGSDVTYDPDLDWYGTDTFTYTVADGNGGFDTATVTMTVSAGPDPPVAVDDTDSTLEDMSITVDVLANDADPDGDGLSVSSGTQGASGSVVNNGSDVTYIPNPNWTGTDTFTYTVTDGNGGFGTAQVTITVVAQPDPPVAVADTDSTPEDTPVTVDVLANDSDPDSDPLSVSAVTQGANGSVANNGTDVTYDPDPDWNGIDTFTYTVTDGNGGFDSSTVTVTVDPVNDDPLAVADTKTVGEDSSVTIPVLDNDSDVEGDPLTITGVIDGSNGVVVNNGTNVTYIPNPDWFGVDTFMYTISDGNGGSASADVTVTVDPVNDDPLGLADSATTFEDTPVGVEVLANDSDVDSSALTVTAVGDGGNGTVTTDGVTATYTPDPDWFGTDTFTYRVSDDLGAWCETTVTVLVRPVNDDPIAFDDIATTPRGTAVYIWVLGNDTDVDPDTLTVSGFTSGANGTVVNNSIKVTYTPAPGWTGTDTFTYTVSDGNGGFDTATVTVSVTSGPNRPPVAKDDTKTINEDTPATIAVLTNDSDPDGDAVTVSAVNQGAHGSVTKTATSVTYRPDKDWTGIDSFSYSISDGRGGTATAAVVITVKPLNDSPKARDDSKSTPEGTQVAIPVLANDADVDGDPLAVATITQGSHGVTTTDGTTVTYSPSPGWSGTDSFTYTITDGHGGSDAAKVLVYVGTANRTPTISVTGETSLPEGDSLRLEVTTEDADGDEVSILVSGLPDWATLDDGGDGRATITGVPGFEAPPSSEITISASDGTDSARITVTIDVVDVNRPPLVGPIAFSGVNDDGSFSFAISASDPDGDPLAISASGLPPWASLTDQGDGAATISSSGVPGDAIGSFSVVISITDGQATVTSSLSRSIADLRVGLPPELTHQAFGIDGTDTLVATALKPRVGTPDPLGAHLTPREGLMVAFGSAVETMKNQILPALVLGVVMAWMLMIGVGRTKEEEEPETA